MEKFKASIARLLPSRRPPTRSKLIKTRDEEDKNANDPNHRCYVPNSLDSECPVETTSTKEFESENSPTDFTASPFPQQTVAATAAVAASDHQSPSAVISPPQINETLSQRKSISDKTLTPEDDNNVNSDSNKRNSKTRWPFHHIRLKLKTPIKADNDFPEAKSELESVLQRVLRSKGERFSSQVQRNSSDNKEDMKIHPKIIESVVYPKRIAFVTEESLQETKQRLRHLDDFNRFGSQCEINNNNTSFIGSSSAVEPDNGICRGSRAESNKEYKCNSTAGVTNNLTSDCLSNNLGISSNATDTSTYESDKWCDHRQSHDFESVSNSSLKNIIFSDIKPTHEINFLNDSGICQSAGLEMPSTSMIRELTAKVMSHQDENRNQKTETPPLMPKGADIFELLRKFEERVADEAATAVKPTTENSWNLQTSATDTLRRSKTPKDDNSTTPAKVINDSWIRTTKTSPDPFHLNASTSSTTSIASAASWIQNRAWDSVETPLVTRSRVLEALESLRQSSNGSDFEPHSQLLRRSNDSQEMDDLASKPHSIAGDHAKNVELQFGDTFVVSQFGEKLSSPQASDQQKTTIVDMHGVEAALPLVAEIAVPTSDIKKSKKVEFSKTEVHFVAEEPRKIKTVKTDEKPLTTNLYRHKRRSLSVFPKMLGFGSSYNKFGNHAQHKKVSDLLIN